MIRRSEPTATIDQLAAELDELRATVAELADAAGIDPPSESARPRPDRPIDPNEVRAAPDPPAPDRARRGAHPGRGRRP